MRTELAIFGRRFNMAPRARRRLLVTLFYGAFAALLFLAWAVSGRASTGELLKFVLTVDFTIFISPVLGGYFQTRRFGGGLVKPFAGNEILRSRSRFSSVPLLRPFYRRAVDPRQIQNDERDLSRRDRAHFLAYRALGTLIAVAFPLAFLASGRFPIVPLFGITVAEAQQAICAILEISYILAFTLPQAILLWTEPDLDPESSARLAGARQ